MLSQGDIEALSIVTEQAASRLEREVMLDIVRRIKINKEITTTAQQQIAMLQQFGTDSEFIKSQIQMYLKATNKEMERLYDSMTEEYYNSFNSIHTKTGKNRIPFLENTDIQYLISATLAQTKNTFQNITNTLGFMKKINGKLVATPLAKYYEETLDNAIIGMTSGAFSYDTVLKKVVNEMTRSGLRTVDYASGRSYRIESASRTAIMTGFGQITGQISRQVAEELGTNDYEISYHIGARPSHQEWQGTVKSYEELIARCGLGTVTGLCGANCYHWYEPFVIGVSVRNYTDEQLEEMTRKENTHKYYNGKEYTTYTALQKQRNMELTMRKQRQDIALLKEGRCNELAILGVQSRYRSTMQEYVEFSKKMQLPQQRDRVYMDGLGSVGKKGPIPNPKRREENIGPFKNLNVPMQNRYVENITKKYGVKISDLKIKIQRDEELLNLLFCGSTDYNNIGRIDLFPNAFKDEELLIRTIIHERCHVLQLKKNGKKYAQENIEKMEAEAYKFEEFWYNIIRKRVK